MINRHLLNKDLRPLHTHTHTLTLNTTDVNEIVNQRVSVSSWLLLVIDETINQFNAIILSNLFQYRLRSTRYPAAAAGDLLLAC